MTIDDNTLVIAAGALLILWLAWRARRKARSPESQTAAAERDSATASLPPGWSVTPPDRERYGASRDAIEAYAVVASGPAGQRVAGIALSEAGAYGTVIAAVRGEISEADAWAPPVDDLTTASVDVNATSDVALPLGWTLVMVDHERFSPGDGPAVSTYGALAIGPRGERALAVTVDRATAVHRLVDRISGRLPVNEGWALRLPADGTAVGTMAAEPRKGPPPP
jgi:hypothetical protein